MREALDILSAAFDTAAEAEVPRRLWWRDDDAVAATGRLEVLWRVAARAGAPLALAAIPARLEHSLLTFAEAEGVTLLQHGARHENHERDGRSAELGAARPVAAITADLVAARANLSASPAFVPVMVPPWNRMRDDLAPALAAAGWRGVSLFGGAAQAGPPVRVDAHLDPIAWRGERSLLPPDSLAAIAARAIATEGPIGLLTHHLVHDDAVAAFVEAFADLVARHPGAAWIGAGELFA